MDVRFLLDEHIDHAIATALRLRGVDVLTLGEANLLSADDAMEILPFALKEGRVLVTRDADFLVMHSEGAAHSGLVYWPGSKRNVKEAIHYLLQLGRKETPESMLGELRFVKAQYP